MPLVGYTPVGGQATYDPDTNTISVAGYGDIPENLGVETIWKNFNPRTGISWRPTDTTVIRAGYGVSALGLPSSWGQAYPIRQVQQISPANSFAPTTVNLTTGVPLPALPPIPASGILDATPLRGEALDIVRNDRTEGTLHSFNVAYQRVLPGGFTAEIAYVGNRGHDILAAYNMNAGLVIGADNAGRPLFGKYGRTADTSDPQPVRSEYNSMQMKVDRRMRNGLLLTNSYTLGRAYSFANGDGAGTISTPADWERGYQRTTFDSTHSFVSSFVYMLPWGPDGKWMKEGAIGKVLGDWQVTGVVSAISGTPIDFTANAAGLRAPGNTNTPNATGTPDVLGGIGSGNLWFDTSVFSAPGQQRVGQRRAARSSERSRVLQPRRVNRESASCGNEARRDPRGLLQCAQHRALRESQRHARQRELRPHHRHPGADRAHDSVWRTLFVLAHAIAEGRGRLEDWKIDRLEDRICRGRRPRARARAGHDRLSSDAGRFSAGRSSASFR